MAFYNRSGPFQLFHRTLNGDSGIRWHPLMPRCRVGGSRKLAEPVDNRSIYGFTLEMHRSFHFKMIGLSLRQAATPARANHIALHKPLSKRDVVIAMSTTDIAIVLATICGPIFAVQAQKMIERSVAAQRRKVEIFTTMMANRARSLDPERIRAMNSIELEFGAHKRFGLTFQSRLDKDITSAYRLYFDRLCENFDKKSSYAATWRDACATLQVDLLLLMARRLGYNFDKAQIRAC